MWQLEMCSKSLKDCIESKTDWSKVNSVKQKAREDVADYTERLMLAYIKYFGY